MPSPDHSSVFVMNLKNIHSEFINCYNLEGGRRERMSRVYLAFEKVRIQNR